MIARALATIAVLGAASAVIAATSCSTVPSDARIGVVAPSGSEAAFGPVGDYLNHRCGSLDCHGQIGRNLRIWGCEGMRLDPNDIPFCDRASGGKKTTPAEHLQTYRSLVGLEPAVMTEVVEGHGQHPELLTFIRKARGTESHKGGVLIGVGTGDLQNVQEQCVTSWLAGRTDQNACVSAIGFPTFALDASTR